MVEKYVGTCQRDLLVMNGFGRKGVAPEPKIHKVSGRGFL